MKLKDRDRYPNNIPWRIIVMLCGAMIGLTLFSRCASAQPTTWRGRAPVGTRPVCRCGVRIVRTPHRRTNHYTDAEYRRLYPGRRTSRPRPTWYWVERKKSRSRWLRTNNLTRYQNRPFNPYE